MWYGVLFISLLLSLQTAAFRLPFRPVEQIRYRAGACETDLERVTYALLKDKTYAGCLKTALDALQQKRSVLSRRFERTYNVRNRQYQMNYEAALKQVLIKEICKRLGQADLSSSFLDRPLIVTEASRENFVQSLNRFCHHNKSAHEAYGQERINRIIYGIENLDIHRLFEGFRRTLRMAEMFEYKDPQVYKGIKRLRPRFLIVLNQMILLKKILAGIPLRDGINVEDVMYQVVVRTEWIEAYHRLKIDALLSDACQEDKRVCTKAFEAMDDLASVVQSFDDLKNVCWFTVARLRATGKPNPNKLSGGGLNENA
ncbi:MAG: hypothetical protein A2621_02125 [Alphaproteobacteria bacterium RIFCSPHIGHO2_01_FULL_41_14]|nr:MAG: hypothetical protein A3K20_00235 [Alphaproteobacteria bacterium GWA1_45_9]OFW89683.1 MAG: hypothetical protein A2621_02125 [Alphaproteobacteria bacterium RIFCSPHIGHO2_01_FULL_41_14]HCI49125.1 hypothetical protein [Holosporales bacterium]